MSPVTRNPSRATDVPPGAADIGGTGRPTLPAGLHGPVATDAHPDDAPADDAPAADAPADGRSTRWEDHREARRAELVRVARRVVHHQGPDASMDDIAAAAGTSKSIVYRYFTDKDGLQLAVAGAVVADIRVALEQAATGASTPRDAVRGMVDTYLAMIESSPHVYTFVTQGGSVAHFVDSVTELVAAPFVRALAAEVPPEDRADAEAWAQLWAAGAVGFVRGAGERWLAARREPGAPQTEWKVLPDTSGVSGRDLPLVDREDVAARVAAWLWAGPVGVLSRERAARTAAGDPVATDSAAPAPVAPDLSRVTADAPTPGEPA